MTPWQRKTRSIDRNPRRPSRAALSLDPFPFREKDLAHIPDDDALDANAKELNEAFHRYFAGRAVAVYRELNELFRVGRRSLVIVVCFISARLAAGYLIENPVQRLVEESLLILGRTAPGYL
ncbi:hypothetical protein [Bradyrhizobium sp. AZCC 1693]|uniref:hypothetical protein n=1 Tax=Bradyrhizobium sp. AZCC 1693 TaxID=3117029 RepID=UPI002FF0C5A4